MGKPFRTLLLLVTLFVTLASPVSAYAAKVNVLGRVDLSPTCAVQQAGQDCVERGAKASVVATDGKLRIKTTSGAKGFSLFLAPGTWTLTAKAGMRCTPLVVKVVASKKPKPVVINCDTGIR